MVPEALPAEDSLVHTQMQQTTASLVAGSSLLPLDQDGESEAPEVSWGEQGLGMMEGANCPGNGRMPKALLYLHPTAHPGFSQ